MPEPAVDVFEVPDGLFHYRIRGQDYAVDLLEFGAKEQEWAKAPENAEPYWWLRAFIGWIKTTGGPTLTLGQADVFYHECCVRNLESKKKQREQLQSMLLLPNSMESTPAPGAAEESLAT